MKSKKMLSIFLCAIMLSITLVGCGSGTSDKTSANSDNVTLTFGLWDKNQEPVLRQIADTFEAQNPNIKIDIQLTPYGQYWTKLEAAATGEVLPDIFWINGPNIVKYASNGILMPIDDKVKEDNIDLSLYPQGLIDLYTVDGKLYGIPKDWDLTVLWYNKKIFDEKGVEYPNENWTFDDMVEAARKLTDKEKGIYGIAARPDTQEGLYNTIPQAGGFIISDDRTKSGYDSPEAVEGTQIWVDLVKEGISPTLEEMADTYEIDMFCAERLAMVYAASWNVPTFMSNETIKDNVDLTVMPLIKERAAIIHGLTNAISANTKQPEEAWEFVKYLAGKEANEIWAKSGVVIPARKDVLDTWKETYPNLNLQAYIDELDYSVMYPVSKNTPKWNDVEIKYIKQILFFLPAITMPAAIATMWKWLYNGQYGLINQLLNKLGLEGHAWIADPKYAMAALIIVGIWSSLGMKIIYFLAGLQGISKSYYEASTIDGAGPIRQFFTITLPLLSPTIFFVSITSLISAFQMFDIIFMMISKTGLAINSTMSIVYLFYKNAFEYLDKGYASAISILLFVIILIITIIQLKLQKKFTDY